MTKFEPQREGEPSASVSSIEDTRRRRHVERLTLHHGDFLRSLARKLCRSQLDPDDLVQDVLEKMLRTPIPPVANERAWLARVTHNLFIDRLRRLSSRREDLTDEAHVAPLPEHEEPRWWEQLTKEEILAALHRLPMEQRTAFELFAFDGKSYDEISSSLGVAKATVGTRILRARQKLRAHFTSERGDE